MAWTATKFRSPGRCLIFGFWMMVSILLGLAAILRRDIARHQVWMMRGYAIAIAAGTQTFTIMPWIFPALQKPQKA